MYATRGTHFAQYGLQIHVHRLPRDGMHDQDVRPQGAHNVQVYTNCLDGSFRKWQLLQDLFVTWATRIEQDWGLHLLQRHEGLQRKQ